VINVRSDGEWQRLRKVIGDPAWATDPALDTPEGRIARREAIDQGLSAWTSAREPREVMEMLQAVGVPAGIVAHPAHHLADPQLQHRGYPKLVVQPGYESLVLEGPPFLGSDLPEPIVAPAPLLGEHTREVAREVLGLSDGEIQKLIYEGVLEDPPKEFKRL
jgi:crotonobetainyl-CoA:carnitine CoA-transferase CaiB-like acyl-CoA transferase